MINGKGDEEESIENYERDDKKEEPISAVDNSFTSESKDEDDALHAIDKCFEDVEKNAKESS